MRDELGQPIRSRTRVMVRDELEQALRKHWPDVPPILRERMVALLVVVVDTMDVSDGVARPTLFADLIGTTRHVLATNAWLTDDSQSQRGLDF